MSHEEYGTIDELDEAHASASEEGSIDLDEMNLGQSEQTDPLLRADDLATERGNADAGLLADVQRISAEYANYRKRVARERELAHENSIIHVAQLLLPIADDVDRARSHGELEGVLRTVGEALESAMDQLGLSRYGAPGDTFDPNKYEALTIDTGSGAHSETVVTVFQPGWSIGGRVIRPARVSVSG